MRERKRMLQGLLEDVTLVRGDRSIQMQICWEAGATTSLERPRPLGVPDLQRTPGAIGLPLPDALRFRDAPCAGAKASLIPIAPDHRVACHL